MILGIDCFECREISVKKILFYVKRKIATASHNIIYHLCSGNSGGGYSFFLSFFFTIPSMTISSSYHRRSSSTLIIFSRPRCRHHGKGIIWSTRRRGEPLSSTTVAAHGTVCYRTPRPQLYTVTDNDTAIII